MWQRLPNHLQSRTLAHTQNCCIDPAIVESTGGKAFFGIFRSSAVAFDLMSSMVAKRAPLRPIFRAGKSQKSLGVRSGEYGGWVMTGMLLSARNCCTTSDVWLGALSWCRNHSPATCRSVSSELHRATSAKLARRNDHRTHQISLRVNFGCFLLLKWTLRGRVSQPWRTSNRMRRPNSRRI